MCQQQFNAQTDAYIHFLKQLIYVTDGISSLKANINFKVMHMGYNCASKEERTLMPITHL
jgi:hypothetical protein